MKLSPKLILGTTIVLIVALIFSQILVISNGLSDQKERSLFVKQQSKLLEKEFDNNVIISLTKVRDRLTLLNKDDQDVYLEPVKQINPNYFVVSFYDTLSKKILQGFIKEEFKSYNIQQEFQVGLYDCFNDSIIFDEFVSKFSLSSDSAKYKPQKWEHDGHYFGVYFPLKRETAIAPVGSFPYTILLAALLILVVILFFGYTINSLFKQKKISNITTDFINNMTHELKTPISTISLSVDVMRKSITGNTEADNRLNRYVGIIKTENKRLENQVERVLRIAKLEKGEIRLNFEELDIHNVIEGCIETFSVPIQEKNGELTHNLTATKTLINGDIIHITNIIYNLLDNANKYSNGKPVINIRTVSSESEIKILISDTGKGISKEDLKFIFDKFYRVSTGNVHNVKGFGLGLYYVKQMVDKHHGTIQAKSKIGEGTTFSISLPLKQ